jgi:hypothetical protein
VARISFSHKRQCFHLRVALGSTSFPVRESSSVSPLSSLGVKHLGSEPGSVASHVSLGKSFNFSLSQGPHLKFAKG